MEPKIFPTPNELFMGMPKPLWGACNYIKGKMFAHEFKFKPDYQYKKYSVELATLLAENGWDLYIDGDQEWILSPKAN